MAAICLVRATFNVGVLLLGLARPLDGYIEFRGVWSILLGGRKGLWRHFLFQWVYSWIGSGDYRVLRGRTVKASFVVQRAIFLRWRYHERRTSWEDAIGSGQREGLGGYFQGGFRLHFRISFVLVWTPWVDGLVVCVHLFHFLSGFWGGFGGVCLEGVGRGACLPFAASDALRCDFYMDIVGAMGLPSIAVNEDF